MSAKENSSTITLHPSRGKHVALLLVCVALFAGGVWMIQSGRGLGWFPAVVFALGIPVFGLNLLPGAASLTLSPEGFSFTSLYRKHPLTPWDHVTRFGIAKVSLNSMLGWDYAPGHTPAGNAPSFAKKQTGYEAALPDTYGMRIQHLVNLMEEWRIRHS